MHRVELKDRRYKAILQKGFVPNAPCGVESILSRIYIVGRFPPFLMHRVELKVTSFMQSSPILLSFLMHRVELKGGGGGGGRGIKSPVPNAPCGVESVPPSQAWKTGLTKFLMHRVELKVLMWICLPLTGLCS